MIDPGRIKATGFTLLEVIVVLVITGLISVVLIQGLGLVLSARNSVLVKIVDIDQVVLHRNLVLEPLRGVVPDYPERPNIFNGSTRRIQGLTIRTLRERVGTPTGFILSLKFDSERNETLVMYQEDGQQQEDAMELLSWPGNSGAFSFRDRAGAWSDIWPVDNADGPSMQTPWLIRLDTGNAQTPTIVATVAGAHRRTLRMQDFPMGATGNAN